MPVGEAYAAHLPSMSTINERDAHFCKIYGTATNSITAIEAAAKAKGLELSQKKRK